MYICLGPEAIGVQAGFARALNLAKRHRFAGVSFSASAVADLIDEQGVDAVRALVDEAGVIPGPFGFPVNFREDEASWRAGLADLPRLAKAAKAIGCDLTATWIKPASDEMDFDENFAFHVARLTPAAQILADHGIRFGLEWVGTESLRTQSKHSFIYTMTGMLELCFAIGTSNMGLLVDCFHILMARDSNNDIRKLKNEQVILVHVNDALADTPISEHPDTVRQLPGETNVIDLNGFLRALHDIGYDGPVMAEPFSQRLRELLEDEAVAETSKAMHKMMQKAGINNE